MSNNWMVLQKCTHLIAFPLRLMTADEHSRARLRRKIFANLDKFRIFLTLTFRNEADATPKNVRNFFNRLSLYNIRHNRKKLEYILVWEQGTENNRLHCHLLCTRWISSTELLKWRKDFGIVKAVKISQIKNVAKYVAKYCSKKQNERTEKLPRKKWMSTRGIEKPIKWDKIAMFVSKIEAFDTLITVDHEINDDFDMLDFAA